MNRRRVLNGVHRSIARQQATTAAVVPVDHSTVERLSIADLDRIGPRLVTAALRTTCPDCNGSGEVYRHITDDIERLVPCDECHGKGYYEERA